MNAKNIDNRRVSGSKPAAASLSVPPRFAPKRPRSHHGLLKGPYFPHVNNFPITSGMA
jgi:hypothetical protein